MTQFPQIPNPQDADAGGAPRCPWCRSSTFDTGFIEDSGQGSRGFARWVVGELQKGPFGGASRFGRERLDISGKRCRACGHLSFFAS